ncbi:MAG: aminotransferase class I/II-fold pyridoxal phosphate-dependent enzyme, partial [Kiritimatiellae bacterium]|nr:aminotransferase class I/II-fold pyridoxal phosphate-dependent enzyme [Kiritimatiellia bacterium]
MKTFSDIANSGIAELGIYEPGSPIEEVARALGFDNSDDIVKLASNENAIGPSPKAVTAMQDVASQMHRYPDGGAYYLKRALADKLGVSVSELLPVNGSNEALELLGHVFLGAGTGIVMAEYAFVVYRLIAAACGASVASVSMRNFTHDLDAMLEAIRPETKIVFISNPNNPTSTIVDESAMDRFMDKVPDHVV